MALTNRTLFTGDNLYVLRGMNSESVDLIYLDPPFNSNANYAAPIGSEAAGAAFKDTWTLDDVDAEWHGQIADEHPGLYKIIDAAGASHSKGMQAYLIMMAIRLIEMQRVLRPTGSIYLHCDPTASHYLKALMDCVFGRTNFRNEIVWYKGYRGTPRANRWQQEHDIILMYGGDARTWNKPISAYKDASMARYNKTDGDGKRYALIKRRRTDGTVYYGKCYPQGKPAGDVIDIPTLAATDSERTGYPTQKPLALLERIIRASSKEGDFVFDPFCGCATTLVAAEKLSRNWGGGADLSDLAVKLVKQRIRRELGGLLFDVNHRTDIPKRTDQGKLPPPRSHAHRLYGEQEGVCAGCRTHFPFRVMQVDHRIPQAKGGADDYDNLQMLCSGCNLRKGTGTMVELLAKLRREGILV